LRALMSFPQRPRPAGATDRKLWRPLLLAACLIGAARAEAIPCLSTPDPAARQLQGQLTRDPATTIRQAQAAIDSLQGSSQPDARRLASLYAVQAQGYSLLELDGNARKVAAQGLELARNVHDAVHLDLLSAFAENVYDQAGIASAVQSIESARTAQVPGSVEDTCLLITLGRLQYRQDRSDLATATLTQAYRASMSGAMAYQRALAAHALSPVMRAMGDYPQALALNQEVINWNSAHQELLSLSVSRFLRGVILTSMRDYAAAIDQFTEARKISVQLADEQGVAFADLRICEAQIELKQLGPARQECESALSVFTASHTIDVVKDAQTLLAHIDLEEGHAERALATLNGVLQNGGADIPPRSTPPIYQLRARTNAVLHNFREAYADLDEYVRRYVAVNDAERTRQAAALRARFETDREIDLNSALQRELVLTQDRAKRQREQLRWTALAIAAGMLVIALLTYILIANLRYRRELVRLAKEDGLTGLPNRRRTVELATAALTHALENRRPLTLAVIDLDHFKTVNDRCGHATGDYVLREFARLSREALRTADIFGRWGGEEFLLVMPETPLELALASLERLRTLALAIRLPATGAGLRVSLSAGLAAADESIQSLDDVIARADAALYKAKSQGRDLVRLSDEAYLTASTGVRRALR
jgi:diguanylate cyclase (GGDEF)-like protein